MYIKRCSNELNVFRPNAWDRIPAPLPGGPVTLGQELDFFKPWFPGCCGLNGGPQKICQYPNPRTCECYFSWEESLQI